MKTLLMWLLSVPAFCDAQTSSDTAINNLTSFDSPESSWSTVADVVTGPGRFESFTKSAGSGIILGEVEKKGSYLATRATYGDVEIEFDFLVGKGTISAVLLEGRYRVNLSDSWAQVNPSFASMGGIGQQSGQDVAGFSGSAPLMNVAKAPGLWQHVRIRFKAPQFANGSKTANAVLEEVYMNNCLVQQNMELQGPSAGAKFTHEESTGPIVFYHNNGTLAIKNFRNRTPSSTTNQRQFGRRRPVNPIVIAPEGRNYLLRSFLNFNNVKRTHVISVGAPQQLNYSYDLKQGALLQVWNGPFVDVTEMWEQRGEPQLARPLGSVIPLSEAPALAVLKDANAAWPDSIAFDDFKNQGYTLDKQRNPTFEYETGGYHVQDKISAGAEGRSLLRELILTNPQPNLYCRIASSTAINPLGKGLYVVGDKAYYIQLDEKLKPFVRTVSKGVELMVPVSADKKLSYSLIW